MIQFPSHPMLTREVRSLGLNHHRIREALTDGSLRQVFHGVYVRGDLDDTVELRAACAGRVLPPHCVICDRSAAWILGVDAYDAVNSREIRTLEVVSLRGNKRSERAGLYGAVRDLAPEDIVSVGGVLVTSPLRTACDLAMLRGRTRAMAILDAFSRAHGLTQRDYANIVNRLAGRRGVIQLRELVLLADPSVESPGESWTRITAYDHGFRDLRPQVELTLPGWGRARIDLADEELKIAVEYDGEEFHTSPEAREHDRRRRDALRRCGWIVIVVTKDDFTGDGLARWIHELRRAYRERRPAPPKRVYAKAVVEFVPRRRY